LIGRFGLNLVKPITKSVNLEKRNYIASTRIIHSQKIISSDRFLLTYDPLISEEICKEHGLDFTKVLNKEHKSNLEKKIDLYQDVSISTSAMVNSYARIYMNKIKLEILRNGGTIYYMDTDSLVVNGEYDISNLLSTDIGKFKCEYDIAEAFFISNKTYCLVIKNKETNVASAEQVIIKAKGVKSTSLTVESFRSMY
jgi:hypothetical protein